VLHAKRLERGRFLCPATADGVAVLTPAQLSMLLEGVDWRHPIRSSQPVLAW
jgi:transposase